MSESLTLSRTPALRRRAWSLLVLMHVPFIAFAIACAVGPPFFKSTA